MNASNYIQVVGERGMPLITGALHVTLSPRDVEALNVIADIRASNRYSYDYIDDDITREDVSAWLAIHSGYFEQVTDFYASIGHTEIHWADLENAFAYYRYSYGGIE